MIKLADWPHVFPLGSAKCHLIVSLKIMMSYGLFSLLDSDSDTDSCTMQDFSVGLDLDSDPLIEMYVIGMEICS